MVPDHAGRLEHQDELDEAIGAWIAERTADEVVEAFEEQEAAIAPVLSIADIFEDPQFLARETITTVEHPDLGPLQDAERDPPPRENPGQHPQLGPDSAPTTWRCSGGARV